MVRLTDNDDIKLTVRLETSRPKECFDASSLWQLFGVCEVDSV